MVPQPLGRGGPLPGRRSGLGIAFLQLSSVELPERQLDMSCYTDCDRPTIYRQSVISTGLRNSFTSPYPPAYTQSWQPSVFCREQPRLMPTRRGAASLFSQLGTHPHSNIPQNLGVCSHAAFNGLGIHLTMEDRIFLASMATTCDRMVAAAMSVLKVWISQVHGRANLERSAAPPVDGLIRNTNHLGETHYVHAHHHPHFPFLGLFDDQDSMSYSAYGEVGNSSAPVLRFSHRDDPKKRLGTEVLVASISLDLLLTVCCLHSSSPAYVIL